MNFSLISICANLHIYTIIPSTKNKNLPNLIILDPLDYKIVLILSLITEIYSYNFPNLANLPTYIQITFFHKTFRNEN